MAFATVPTDPTAAGVALVEQVGTRQTLSYEVECTGCGATDQFAIRVPSIEGAIVLVDFTLVSGDAATIQPAFGRAAGFTTATTDPTLVGQVSSAAARIYETSQRSYMNPSLKLWVQPTPDSGTNNVVLCRIVIAGGVPS